MAGAVRTYGLAILVAQSSCGPDCWRRGRQGLGRRVSTQLSTATCAVTTCNSWNHPSSTERATPAERIRGHLGGGASIDRRGLGLGRAVSPQTNHRQPSLHCPPHGANAQVAGRGRAAGWHGHRADGRPGALAPPPVAGRMRAMQTWLANTRDAFKTQLWPIPTIAVVAALLLGLGLPRARRERRRAPAQTGERLALRRGRRRGTLAAGCDRLLADHGDRVDVLPDRGDPAAGEQPVLPAAAADLHQRPVRAGDPGAVPRDLHLLADRAARGAQRRRQRAGRVRPEVRGHPGVRAGGGAACWGSCCSWPISPRRSGSRRCCATCTATHRRTMRAVLSERDRGRRAAGRPAPARRCGAAGRGQ